jgi:iron complex transport system permease protein
VPWALGILAFLLVLGVALGVLFGPAELGLSRPITALFGTADSTAETVVWDLRLPRVVAALAVGAGLGVAGLMLQGATRNPLGDPQLFGVGGGAAVIQALALAGVIDVGLWGLVTLSVAASLTGAGLIAFFSSRQQLSPARVALIGISLAVLSAAVATGMLAQARIFSQQSLTFLSGSLANRTWSDTLPALPFLALGIILAFLVVGRLNLLGLGDRVAVNIRARPNRTRIVAITSSGILGGASVAIAGMVGFVGLLVPHVARLIVGHDLRAVFLVSIPLGSAVVLYADQVARLAFMPTEIPAGMVTAILGAPLMIYAARRVF